MCIKTIAEKWVIPLSNVTCCKSLSVSTIFNFFHITQCTFKTKTFPASWVHFTSCICFLKCHLEDLDQKHFCVVQQCLKRKFIFPFICSVTRNSGCNTCLCQLELYIFSRSSSLFLLSYSLRDAFILVRWLRNIVMCNVYSTDYALRAHIQNLFALFHVSEMFFKLAIFVFIFVLKNGFKIFTQNIFCHYFGGCFKHKNKLEKPYHAPPGLLQHYDGQSFYKIMFFAPLFQFCFILLMQRASSLTSIIIFYFLCVS